ncbi:zinc finger BED domain-containing 1-like [Brachionus plicatilis]|uniref:Zinc finger BED domain-containing 1-like n=1 Tax=Brachionus plicatilis TaxID=10195 RepID=A0A3M7RYV1_BRAPC|nr:zinc finger BED domain-containing 1-like [Brachionus plicatilis]
MVTQKFDSSQLRLKSDLIRVIPGQDKSRYNVRHVLKEFNNRTKKTKIVYKIEKKKIIINEIKKKYKDIADSSKSPRIKTSGKISFPFTSNIRQSRLKSRDKGDSYLDPLRWWKDNQTHFPTISRLTEKNLGVTATSASIERLFSKTGFIHLMTNTLAENYFFFERK